VEGQGGPRARNRRPRHFTVHRLFDEVPAEPGAPVVRVDQVAVTVIDPATNATATMNAGDGLRTSMQPNALVLLTVALANSQIVGSRRWRPAALGTGVTAGRGIAAILPEKSNPSPPALPYPLPSERAVINCCPAVKPKGETPGHG
jgi:hypothetical protein